VGVADGVSYGPGKDAADRLHETEMAAGLAFCAGLLVDAANSPFHTEPAA
jgi:hypothetical protein